MCMWYCKYEIETAQSTLLPFVISYHITKKNLECDVGMMIDRDVAEKRFENKVGIASY